MPDTVAHLVRLVDPQHALFSSLLGEMVAILRPSDNYALVGRRYLRLRQ
jgi:hypothetical protein